MSFLHEHCDFDASNKEITVNVTGIKPGKTEQSFKDTFGIKLVIFTKIINI